VVAVNALLLKRTRLAGAPERDAQPLKP
jgi:hypothetical protein